MKRIFIILLAVISCKCIQAQSTGVGIGTTTPDPSALLDIKSNSKGLLIPTMSSSNRTGLASPANGLLVYDSTESRLYQYQAGSWRYILNNDTWRNSTTRNHIYNTTDSVGIGTASPLDKLHISNGNARVYGDIINSGNVGAGTLTPVERLHIFNGKMYMQDNRTGENPQVIFDVPGFNDNEAGLQFKRNGDTIASLNYVVDPDYPDFIRMGVGNPGTKSDLIVNTNGEIGIGTRNPLGQLSMAPYSGDNLVINDVDGIIQFYTPILFGSPAKKAFIQLVDNEDLRMGTNSANNTGRIIFRTNSTDHMAVSPYGGLGIGTVFPLTRLHIEGGSDADLSSATNGFIMLGTSISSSNLLIDNNEIMVRNGYSTAGTLSLQNDGGELAIGARTTINKSGEALKFNGNNPNVAFVTTSGASNSFISQEASKLFIGVNNGKLHLDATQVAIGGVSNAANGYKLTVTGKVICEEVRVKLSTAWPDYVFEDNHQLLPLQKLSEFIKTNKHLPNIPSANEIEKNGMELGDMQTRMMQKIEELTLYILQQQKEIEELKTRIKR